MSIDFFGRPSGDSGGGSQTGTTLRPQPPLAKRLNRNALTVAAVIMGMTVLTAIVVLNPGSNENGTISPVQASPDEPPPVPPRPAFLDEPARVSVDNGSPLVGTEAPARAAASGVGSGMATAQMASSAADPHTPFSTAVDDEQSKSAAPQESARDRAYQAALSSSVLAGPGRAESSGSDVSASPTPRTDEEQLVALGDSIMRAALRQTVPGEGGFGRALAQDADARATGSPASVPAPFSTQAVDAASSTTIAQIEPAGSPYTLRAGTVIPGLLITGISSELPGEIVGQVSRNVYDSRTQRIPLIPKGSRLIGTYDNQVVAGQGRLLVAWTRLILPDGRSVRLPGLALTDPAGQSGAKDKVDNHWRRVFGNALLLSAIGAGVQLSQPPQTSVLSTPSAGQVAAGAIGQELSSVALEILRRGMDVAPTITIRAGQPFNVFLSGDLVLDAPYNPGG